ncbi:MAG TPA: amidohydrolase family protein [Baekduia sp.]|nr:amidohydrolase family protein [Baekduia sp.]
MILEGRLALDGADASGWVELDGRHVAAAGHGRPPRRADQRVAGLLAPGLVDVQVNGAAGHEVTEGDAALNAIEAALLDRGVTAWLPTVVTTDEATAAAAVARLAERAADPASTVAGIHLEGPFLSPEHAGIHRPELLRAPAGGVPAYVHHPAVRMVTLAPELPGARALVAQLAGRGVTVALGHSGADATAARAAIDAGARMVTHLFNAMGPLDHRRAGLAAVALTDERLAVGVIADGVHVDPTVLALIARACARRVVLVSDASPAAAAREIPRSFAGMALDAAGRAPSGRPAGGLALLDEDVRTWAAATGQPLAAALAAASVRPARLAGLPPPLSPGARADLLELADDGTVRRVMLAGRWRG